MGHLVRSTEIIRRLVKDFRVCLINGGQTVPGFEFPPEAEVIHLPALWEDGNELKPVDNDQTIEEVKARRQQNLLHVLEHFEPDCLITECFPFSKHKLMFELIPLLERAQSSGAIARVCSLRDLIMTQPMSPKARAKRQEKVCRLLNQYYDLVLVHADPKLVRLEECFPIDKLNGKVYYTGYVAQSYPHLTYTAEDIVGLSESAPIIVASAGGGRHGYELLRAVVAASALLDLPHHVHVFAGPFMPEEEFGQLQAAGDRGNVMVRRFTSHLTQYMQKADLSISLGGYNTIMNILKTKVRSLVLPSLSEHQSGEQGIRAQKLEKLGIIDILRPDELKPTCLAQKIVTSLKKEPINDDFDLEGAEKAALRLKKLLYSKIAA